ncbi:hypothetical protein ALC62_07999 [Cyphomyrmex costatus]|uniref:Uncharacterized protein n=1 Tax=Cyphomyrmex costatus TaxID=456900 RepID=A0A151K2G0_9HYME|nr:hypothetical protein ALC62_07999 [Cyphomyrmex costatus]
MTKTLQSALAPLFIISSFCCFTLFEYPIGQPRPYYSCLYVLVVWSSIVYYYLYPLYIDQLEHEEIYFTDIIYLIIILLILISLYRCKVKFLNICPKYDLI